jgi:hypothetical protein
MQILNVLSNREEEAARVHIAQADHLGVDISNQTLEEPYPFANPIPQGRNVLVDIRPYRIVAAIPDLSDLGADHNPFHMRVEGPLPTEHRVGGNNPVLAPVDKCKGNHHYDDMDHLDFSYHEEETDFEGEANLFSLR